MINYYWFVIRNYLFDWPNKNSINSVSIKKSHTVVTQGWSSSEPAHLKIWNREVQTEESSLSCEDYRAREAVGSPPGFRPLWRALHRWRLLFSCSVMSDSLQSHGLQRSRLPCLSPSPGACWNSCPLSWWCHPTISSSVTFFSSCPQSFPASGSFPMSWLFTSGGQRIRVSASASVLPMNIQDWFPLGLTNLTSLLSKELWRVFSSLTVWKHQFFGSQPSLWSRSPHIHTWLLEKP